MGPFATFSTDGIPPFVGPEFTESYARVATVRACVDRISSDAGCVPGQIHSKNSTTGDLTLLEPKDHPVAAAFATANPREGRTRFWKSLFANLQLNGENFWYTSMMGRKIDGFFNLMPNHMKVIPGPGGIADGYRYEVNGNRIDYAERDILFTRLFNPEDDWRGLPPLKSAQVYAAIELTTAEHWWAFYKNGARLGLVLETDVPLSVEQMTEMKQAWTQGFEGAGNSGKTAFLHSGMKAHEIGTNQKDSDFVQSFRLSREQILMSFGVPPAMVGIFEFSNYSNSDMQAIIYVENTILPLLKLVEDDVNEILLPRLPDADDLVFKFDTSTIPALQLRLAQRAEGLAKEIQNGTLNPNEVRRLLGRPAYEGGNTYFIQSAAIPVGTAIEGSRAEIRAIGAMGTHGGRKFIDSPDRNVKRANALATLDAMEKETLADWVDYFDGQEIRVLQNLRGKGKGHEDVETEDIFNLDLETTIAMGVALRVIGRMVTQRGRDAAELVGGSADDFLLDNTRVQNWIRTNALEEATAITKTTAAQIRVTILESNKRGDTIDELTNELVDTFRIKRLHANTIARTETVRAYNFATLEGFDASGLVTEIEWLTAGDEAVRSDPLKADHASADGQRVPMGKDFSVSGELLSFPGDPKGSASNVINCRCVVAESALAEDDDTRSFRVADDILKKLGRVEYKIPLTNGHVSK